MKRRWIAFLLALTMMLSLAGCGAADEPPAEAVQPPAADESETRVFVDDVGREVEIPAEISRIVPSAAMSQIVLMAIAPDMFVGLASQYHDSSSGIIPDEVLAQPYFGGLYSRSDLNVEELALTNPQIIIDIGEAKKSTKDDLDGLQRQTLIPSVFISATLETMPETYRKLGKLLGREERGEELAQFCEKVYERTMSIMEQVGDNKVSCLYVLGEEGLNVIAATSYHAELLDMLTNNLAVVDNPLGKGTGNEVTMEQISVWNPDFVIFGAGSIYSTVKERETWSQLKAIDNGDYIEVPDTPHDWMGMPPSVQRYLGMIWLTAELYPEYCDYDVKSEIAEYYKLFYGCDLTDEQYESITANAFRGK
ncbi:MAG: ABC transporter substrate-binding protein [Oscillospiraceae bacterium]|nr:ABC transporter substrate-binding protein [Oscillospiraceae bacterium]